jgi:low temperature requirement protein LtrA
MNCPNIKQNEGTIDRTIRVVIGSVALLAGYFWLGGTLQTIAYVVGVVALATGLLGFCGLYSLLGVSTCKNTK